MKKTNYNVENNQLDRKYEYGTTHKKNLEQQTNEKLNDKNNSRNWPISK